MSQTKNAREALMRAAERLYAEKGLDYVSTREILNEAGQKNQSALQYHFENKLGLLWAIFDDRMKQIEAQRTKILAADGGSQNASLETVLEAIIRPLVEYSNDREGGLLFLQLAMQSAHRPDTNMLQIMESGRYPVARELVRALDRHLGHLPERERRMRLRLTVEACVGTVWIWTQGVTSAGDIRPEDIETYIKTSIKCGMACAQLESQAA